MGFSPIGVICTRMYVIVCASSSHAVVFDENFDHGLFFFQFVVKTMFCHFYDVQHVALDECPLTFFFWRGVCLSLSGCKFSVEEERVVIELQAQFGNKWARIATYLPGRTDNDVKNFWSSRQKRLARILQTSGTANKPQKNKRAVQTCHDVPASQVNVFENLLPLLS